MDRKGFEKTFFWAGTHEFGQKKTSNKSKAGGGDGGGDGDDGGSIFPGHPGHIPNAPRDNISRKGIPSLRQYRYTLHMQKNI